MADIVQGADVAVIAAASDGGRIGCEPADAGVANSRLAFRGRTGSSAGAAVLGIGEEGIRSHAGAVAGDLAGRADATLAAGRIGGAAEGRAAIAVLAADIVRGATGGRLGVGGAQTAELGGERRTEGAFEETATGDPGGELAGEIVEA